MKLVASCCPNRWVLMLLLWLLLLLPLLCYVHTFACNLSYTNGLNIWVHHKNSPSPLDAVVVIVTRSCLNICLLRLKGHQKFAWQLMSPLPFGSLHSSSGTGIAMRLVRVHHTAYARFRYPSYILPIGIVIFFVRFSTIFALCNRYRCMYI